MVRTYQKAYASKKNLIARRQLVTESDKMEIIAKTAIFEISASSMHTNMDLEISHYTGAAKWIIPAAEGGDAEARFILGQLYERGEGLNQSYKKAAKWYKRAAEQGIAKAQFCLGQMYEYGVGVPQNNMKAVNWYRLAAEEGIAAAQYRMGELYEYGMYNRED